MIPLTRNVPTSERRVNFKASYHYFSCIEISLRLNSSSCGLNLLDNTYLRFKLLRYDAETKVVNSSLSPTVCVPRKRSRSRHHQTSLEPLSLFSISKGRHRGRRPKGLLTPLDRPTTNQSKKNGRRNTEQWNNIFFFNKSCSAVLCSSFRAHSH